MNYTTIEAVDREFNEVYLLADEGIVRLIIAVVLANRMGISQKPVWLLVIGSSAGGKCLAPNTPVRMFDGSVRKAKEIQRGDKLMGDDSTPRTVQSTTSGTDKMYTVKQKHGKNYTVNSQHILSLKGVMQKNKGKITDISVEDYLSSSKNFHRSNKGYKVGVKYSEKEVQLEPYFLGLWLGDGHRNSTAITKPDWEIANYLHNYADRLDLNCTKSNLNARCPKYSIVGPKGAKNYISEKLREYKLFSTRTRFIPQDYKINSAKNRMALLAGLLDSDGYLDERQRFQFTNKSKQLVKDLQELARSLGFRVSNARKINKGIKSTGFRGMYWMIDITGETYQIPTQIPRKQAQKRKEPHGFATTAIEVKEKGTGTYYGFELDGNGRFLLGDYTVTHNSAVLDSLSDIAEWIVKVDSLTTNTFASGLQVKGGKSASLLDKANGGILVFKDFTTLTSMNKDGLVEIMGQLRAIYDGAYKKETGNNVEVDWEGNVGIIAAGTHAVQNKMREFSAQGERFINYQLLQPDNKEMTRKAIDNHATIKAKESHLRAVVAEFANYIMSEVVPEMADIDDETKDEIVNLTDFATLARSPVHADRSSKGNTVSYVPDREMAARMATQLIGLIETFKVMEGGLLSDVSKKVAIRIALDSIPLDRRMVLRLLTRHSEATTKGIAKALHYPTETVHWWCQQLDARGLIDRINQSGPSDWWKIRKEHRQIMSQYDDIEILDKPLDTSLPEDDTEEEEPVFDEVDSKLWKEYRNNQPIQGSEEDSELDRAFNEF